MPNNQRIGFNCPASSGDPISIYLNRTISGSNSVSIRYWDAEGVSWIELYYYDANDGGKKKKREIPAGRKRPTK